MKTKPNFMNETENVCWDDLSWERLVIKVLKKTVKKNIFVMTKEITFWLKEIVEGFFCD